MFLCHAELVSASGDLSNPVAISVVDGNLVPTGCAFSPSGQYLYICTNEHVYQFDTYAADINASKIIVATYDGYVSGLHSTFFMMQLAPDHKIYISTWEGTDVMHVINDPDSSGLSCNLVQHQLRLPSFNSQGLPNLPNYDLGSMIGSVCDSLVSGIQNTAPSKEINLFPNPAHDKMYVTLNQKIKSVTVLNTLGEVLPVNFSFTKNSEYIEINTSPLSQGIYFLELLSEKEKVVKRFAKE